MILIENWAAFLRNQTFIWLLEGAVVPLLGKLVGCWAMHGEFPDTHRPAEQHQRREHEPIA